MTSDDRRPERRPERRPLAAATDHVRLRASVARRLVFAAASRISGGRLVLVDRDGVHRFGEPSRGESEVVVTVHDPRAYALVAEHGSTGLGDAYELGWIDTDDLVGFLRLLIRSVGPLDRARDRWHEATRAVLDPLRRLRRPSTTLDRENVRSHYDLGDELFELFLDPTLTYSCAVFEGPATSLEQAQVAKLDRICRKLELAPTHRVAEIGTGWGSFALHGASVYGCHVTTTTVSAAQHAHAVERVDRAGLADRIDVLDAHYRSMRGRYDRLVSIEMIEAVDWREHDDYFRACAQLLEPHGAFGLQAIVIADQRYARARVTSDFIKNRIFPGGSLPSIESIASSLRRATDLRIVHLEDLGSHYARTLSQWRARFVERLASSPDVAVDRGLARRWVFYLAYCEAAFAQRHVSVVQAVLAKPEWRPGTLGWPEAARSPIDFPDEVSAH